MLQRLLVTLATTAAMLTGTAAEQAGLARNYQATNTDAASCRSFPSVNARSQGRTLAANGSRSTGCAITCLNAQILDSERAAALELTAQKRRVVGVKAVLATSPLAAPTTRQTHGNLNPLLAGGDTEALRIATTALRLFRAAYRMAWQLFKSGSRLSFPAGLCSCARRTNPTT